MAKLMETEIVSDVNLELVKIIDWIPKVWHHLNRFLRHTQPRTPPGRGGRRAGWGRSCFS